MLEGRRAVPAGTQGGLGRQPAGEVFPHVDRDPEFARPWRLLPRTVVFNEWPMPCIGRAKASCSTSRHQGLVSTRPRQPRSTAQRGQYKKAMSIVGGRLAGTVRKRCDRSRTRAGQQVPRRGSPGVAAALQSAHSALGRRIRPADACCSSRSSNTARCCGRSGSASPRTTWCRRPRFVGIEQLRELGRRPDLPRNAVNTLVYIGGSTALITAGRARPGAGDQHAGARRAPLHDDHVPHQPDADHRGLSGLAVPVPSLWAGEPASSGSSGSVASTG